MYYNCDYNAVVFIIWRCNFLICEVFVINFKFKKLACVLSSMLILASVSYRVSSMEPGKSQSVLDLKSRILEAFGSRPSQWGLRGDSHFWYYLKEHFSKMKIDESYTSRDFENEIYKVFEQISNGQKLSKGKLVYIKSLDHNGMSGGCVCGSWWIEEGIPDLKNQIFGVSYSKVLLSYSLKSLFYGT